MLALRVADHPLVDEGPALFRVLEEVPTDAADGVEQGRVPGEVLAVQDQREPAGAPVAQQRPGDDRADGGDGEPGDRVGGAGSRQLRPAAGLRGGDDQGGGGGPAGGHRVQAPRPDGEDERAEAGEAEQQPGREHQPVEDGPAAPEQRGGGDQQQRRDEDGAPGEVQQRNDQPGGRRRHGDGKLLGCDVRFGGVRILTHLA
ncbi:hypothetical protein GCM10027610_138410 [Dactylosporangium cerinum]